MKKLACFGAALMLSMLSFAQQPLIWAKNFNGKGDFSDRYNSVVTDASGNIYLGGSTVNTDQNRDYLIEKLDANGNLIWRSVFPCNGGGPDEVKAIKLAGTNRVVVTGYGNHTGTGNDFWTMYMDAASGDTLWTRLFNDPTLNQYDQANDLAVDSQGNIIVTGEGDRDVTGVTNDDLLVVKYDQNGNLLWSQRFNDIGDATDRGEKVVVDNANNIYVAGRSNNGADDDFVTIKYNAQGAQQWIQFVDYGGIDRATDMGIDAQNNIYVTGRRSNGADDDYCTVKYSSAGTLIFTKFFDFVEDDRAEAIAVNSDGSFAVTGRSDANATAVLNYNYYTVKYDVNGNQVWALSFEGAGTNDDWATSIALNSAGDVAVTGFSDEDPSANIKNSMVTLLYSAGGAVVWTNTVASPGADEGIDVTFSPAGKVIACGFKSTDLVNRDALCSIIQNGTSTEHSFGGEGDVSDNVREIEVDASGNLYAVGYSVKLDNDRDFFLLKLNTLGDTLWTRSISGSLYGSDEEANSLVIDPSGNIIVAGYIKNSGTGSDILVQKFSPAGVQLWSTVWDNNAHESDRAYDVQTDASGNIYIVGKTDIDPVYTTNDQGFVAKFSSAGAVLWTYTFNGTSNYADRLKLLRINAAGEVIAVGRKGTATTSDDLLVLKLSTGGQLTWSYTWDGNNGYDDPVDVKLDANGNIFIAANASSAADLVNRDAALIALNAQGALQWEYLYDGGQDDYTNEVIVDGNLKMTVSSNSGTALSPDYAALLLEVNNGALVSNYANGLNDGLDQRADHIVSANGVVTLIGRTGANAPYPAYDLFLRAYDANGSLTNLNIYPISDSSEFLSSVIVRNNSLWGGGSTADLTGRRNMLFTYFDLTLGIQENVAATSFQVFPNPATDQLFINESIIRDHATVSILNSEGQLMSTVKLTSGQKVINIESLPSGIYTLQLWDGKMQRYSKFVKTH